jgi:hypothetical protein
MAYIGLTGDDGYTTSRTRNRNVLGDEPLADTFQQPDDKKSQTTFPDTTATTANPELTNDNLEHVAGGKPTGNEDGKTAVSRMDENFINDYLNVWGAAPGANPSVMSDRAYWLRRIKETGGLGADNLEYWRKLTQRAEGAPEGGTTTTTTAPAPTFNAPVIGNNPNVFSDPATKEWEQALRAMVDRLNKPTNLPDYQPLVDYMRQYIEQLKQPGHTPEQQDLIQTQTLDPLERQRQAAHQQVIQRLAARGIAPSSGIVEKALEDVDRQFEQLRTKTQADFSKGEIELNQSNKDRALAVGGQLAGLEAGMASGDEQRATQAVNMLFQLPQFANTRLQLALQTLGSGQVNPGLFSNLGMFQQQGQQQQQNDQNYYANIAALIAQLFGGSK